MLRQIQGAFQRPIARGVFVLHQSTVRLLHTSQSFGAGSFFGDLTKSNPLVQAELEEAKTASTQATKNVSPDKDENLQKYHMEEALKEQITPSKYITPLKRILFEANVAKNGFFKNGQICNHQGEQYILTLTEEEIGILEPNIYLQSFRIKSSLKKATQVNRFVRGFKVKTAINQLHFNPKKMSTELEKLLKTGLKQAGEMGLDQDTMYIDSLWVGSDGKWRKRPDCKGRGRVGIIEHPYVHLKAVLRSQTTIQRKQWEKAQRYAETKPKMFLNNEPLNFKVRALYKW